MLKRKVVTLACAAGILATGACFLPPLPDRKPPAPPIALDLQGVKSIGVQVVDKSAVQRVSSSALAGAIALRLATEGRRADLAVFRGETLKEHDALLEVTILNVSAVPVANSSGSGMVWDLDASVSAVLARNGGKVIWQETGDYHTRYETGQESEGDLWKDDAILKSRLSQEIANKLVFRLLNAR
jgi:hypothetical protein